MKSVRHLLVASLIILGLTPSAHADHHLMKIEEIFFGTGLNTNENAQFVELRTQAANQDAVTGHQVKFYNSTGTLVETATFSNDADNASGDNAPILAATQAAEAMFGITADVEFDPQVIRNGGKVCFESTSAGVIDCVAWGNYTGPSGAPGPGNVGAPFNPGEGIPVGAAIGRDADTNNSRNDFSFVAADPEGGGNANNLQVIEFESPSYLVSEGLTNTSIDIERSGASGTQVVDFQTLEGTADEGIDYADESPDPKVQLDNGELNESESVASLEDAVFEGDETVRLRLRNPTNAALLGPRLNATLTITDDDPDTTAPRSRITKPKHKNSYDSDNLNKINGTADDGPGTLAEVRVALRRNMTNGKCFWLLNSGWKKGPCAQKKLRATAGDPSKWRLSLGLKLKRSRGTNVKSYTAYSSALDVVNNAESNYQKGRNANTFEIT